MPATGASAATSVSVRVEPERDRLWRDQRGAAPIKYALLIALVTLTILGVIIEVGIWVNGMWGNFPGAAPW